MELARGFYVLEQAREIAKLEGDLKAFVREAWHTVCPSPYQDSWAIDALCDHLQAVTEGKIKRLLVNFPPRCGKTLVATVLWPVWIWARRQKDGQHSGPQARFISASYNEALVMKNAGDTKKVIDSEWFKERWGSRFKLRKDTVAFFENDKNGGRHALSVGGSLLGVGADIIIVDDPHNLNDVESDADRETVRRWWRELSSTRLNDPRSGAIVVIMQRLHQEDLSGVIQNSEMSTLWTHLQIPMEYDPARHCQTEIGWSDPRTAVGELMWPDRFDRQYLKMMLHELGPYMYSGRLQQMPSPAGGGIIKDEWWQWWDPEQAIRYGIIGRDAKFLRYPKFDTVIASLDTAYTSKHENDPSAMTVWGVWEDAQRNRKIMLAYAWQEHLEFNDLLKKVLTTCKQYRVDRLLVEATAAGYPVIQEMNRLYESERFLVHSVKPEKDKEARLHSVVPLFTNNMIYAPSPDGTRRFAWAQTVINQCSDFPKGKHDDLVDTISQALLFFRKSGLAERSDEREASYTDSLMYRKPQQPLYPGM